MLPDCQNDCKGVGHELQEGVDNHYKRSGEGRKITAKIVPKMKEQKQQHVQVCHDLLEQLETEQNLMEKVITGNKS